ncbi:MAG: helix-turn-helix domain-containing protein [Bacteroidaceae bacterium]
MKRIHLPFQRIDLNLLENRINANGSLMAYTDKCGFFLCQRGEARLSINNQTFRIRKGDVYLYLPATYAYVLETSPDLKGITYKSTTDYVLPLIAESRFIKDIITLRNNPCISLTPKCQRSIEDLVLAIESRQEMLEDATNEYCQNILFHAITKLAESLIHEIIFYFISMQPVSMSKLDNKDYILQNFIINLMSRYKEHREIAYYAHLQNLTPRYFSSVIKEKSSRTPQQWVVQMVVNSVKQTLLYTPKSIKEIAEEFHFANQSFLGKYFKEYVGMSPKDFREKMKMS